MSQLGPNVSLLTFRNVSIHPHLARPLGIPLFYFPWCCCKPNSQAQRSTGENCICQYIIMRASWQHTQHRSASECQHVCFFLLIQSRVHPKAFIYCYATYRTQRNNSRVNLFSFFFLPSQNSHFCGIELLSLFSFVDTAVVCYLKRLIAQMKLLHYYCM